MDVTSRAPTDTSPVVLLSLVVGWTVGKMLMPNKCKGDSAGIYAIACSFLAFFSLLHRTIADEAPYDLLQYRECQ
ncbi:hypothetical protein B0H14DRAFT_2788214 [Mycena olivaceomarginata]|nr:hypothetical protein B0H14DRAFT_2788214 [Mycena olivaceomarginata]